MLAENPAAPTSQAGVLQPRLHLRFVKSRAQKKASSARVGADEARGLSRGREKRKERASTPKPATLRGRRGPKNQETDGPRRNQSGSLAQAALAFATWVAIASISVGDRQS